MVSTRASTPQRFAEQAGVERGSVVGFLSCDVLNGDTESERALADRGILAIGFERAKVVAS